MLYGLKKIDSGWVVCEYYDNPISEPEATKEAAFVEMVRMLAESNNLYINIKPSDVSEVN